MSETATQEAPETKEVETPKVENPEGVLKKNQELLGKLTKAEQERKDLADKVSQFEAKEAERERARLEKRGEWETLRDNLETSHKTALESEQARYKTLFENASRDQLAVAIGKHDLAEGASAERLAKLLLLDEIKPTEENGKVVWRKIATDEQVDLNEFIPSIATAYGEYFASDNNPGGDAPGNNGKRIGSVKKRSEMSTAEKSAYIAAHGNAAYQKLPY